MGRFFIQGLGQTVESVIPKTGLCTRPGRLDSLSSEFVHRGLKGQDIAMRRCLAISGYDTYLGLKCQALGLVNFGLKDHDLEFLHFGLKGQHIAMRLCLAISGLDSYFGLKGQHILAQGNALGKRNPSPLCALKGRNNESIPYVPFIVFNPVLFQKQTKFVLKRHAVMHLLVFVIPPCARHLRGDYGKRAASALLMESRKRGALGLDPFGRTFLGHFDDMA